VSTAGGSALLICNEVETGRAVGRACAQRGLEPPAWCVPLAPTGEPQFDAFVIVDGEDYPGRRFARRLAEGAGGRNLLLVGEMETQPGEGAQIIRPERGYEALVADRLIDLLSLSPALLPTYENRLRVLGRELERRGIGWETIRETSAGLRVRPDLSDQPEPFEFGHDEFRRRVREALTARGEQVWERPRSRRGPVGHERLLRAIGYDLDRRCAQQVQIVALASTIVVAGLEAVSPYDPAEPFQQLLSEIELRDVVERFRTGRQSSRGWRARLSRLLPDS
jgi:hypothetical protein